jgi:hypothetical protein
MKFSLVHPSRGRIQRAEDAIVEWRGRASGAHAVEYLLSVDDDDPSLDSYRELAARQAVGLVVGSNRRMVDAMNRGAACATGDVIVGISDDFGCPDRWDAAIAEVVGDRRDCAVLVHDGIDARILTLPVLGRAFYDRLGFVYHPSYVSMFADDDLTAIARRDGVLLDATHLRFPHRHYAVAMSAIDPTYARQNSNEFWWHGWHVYEKRRLTDFGRRPLNASLRWALFRIDAYYRLRTSGSRVRRWWLGRLTSSQRRWESHIRHVFLRAAERAASIHAPE